MSLPSHFQSFHDAQAFLARALGATPTDFPRDDPATLIAAERAGVLVAVERAIELSRATDADVAATVDRARRREGSQGRREGRAGRARPMVGPALVPMKPQGGASAPDDLILDSRGNVVANEANALTIVRSESRFDPLHFDTFHAEVRTTEPGGRARPWTDDDDVAALEYIQRKHCARMKLSHVERAARKVARERPRDALQEHLEALPPWDGESRIDRWTVDALGCADTAFARAAGSNLLKAMMARALHGGCDVHEVYILEGAQGIGKTRALRALGDSFYGEISSAIGSPDFMREIRGLWLADLAELSQVRRAIIEVVKQVLSRGEDRTVEKYEREARTYQRRCVFVGSTNENTYLADTTGNRRFVPLRCGDQIRVEMIAERRDQWLAEALHRVRNGESWHEFPGEAGEQARTEREARRMADPWEAIVGAWLEGRQETWTGAVFDQCLEMPKRERTGTDEQRLTRVLRTLGWRPRGERVRRAGALVRPWVPAQVPGEVEQQPPEIAARWNTTDLSGAFE